MTEAERLADALKLHAIKPLGNWTGKVEEATEAAEELCRLSVANAELVEALKRLLAAERDEYLTEQGVRNFARAAIKKHGEPK